jgi:hypothetical protein
VRFGPLNFHDCLIVQLFGRRLLIPNSKEPKERVRVVWSIKEDALCGIAIPSSLDVTEKSRMLEEHVTV